MSNSKTLNNYKTQCFGYCYLFASSDEGRETLVTSSSEGARAREEATAYKS
jgi:hypothetical protein